jgi:hypothetical protein
VRAWHGCKKVTHRIYWQFSTKRYSGVVFVVDARMAGSVDLSYLSTVQADVPPPRTPGTQGREFSCHYLSSYPSSMEYIYNEIDSRHYKKRIICNSIMGLHDKKRGTKKFKH